jgi:hypothetical protein
MEHPIEAISDINTALLLKTRGWPGRKRLDVVGQTETEKAFFENLMYDEYFQAVKASLLKLLKRTGQWLLPDYPAQMVPHSQAG